MKKQTLFRLVKAVCFLALLSGVWGSGFNEAAFIYYQF